MNNYKIIWSPKANEDLKKIYFYIAHYLNEDEIAKNLINIILDSISKLNYFPERHSRICIFENNLKITRKLIVNNFIVLYQVDNNTRTSLYLTYFSWKSKLFKSIIN